MEKHSTYTQIVNMNKLVSPKKQFRLETTQFCMQGSKQESSQTLSVLWKFDRAERRKDVETETGKA